MFQLYETPLRFDRHLEERFRRDYHLQTIPATRAALALGVALYGAFGILDYLTMPISRDEIWVIRFGVVCPIFAILLGLSFVRRLWRNMQGLVSLGVLAAGWGIVAMIALSDASELGHQYYISGLLLVVMFAYGFTRLRFWPATLTNLAIVLAYEFVAIHFKQALASIEGTLTFILHNFFFLGANLIGLFTALALESYSRMVFLQKMRIEDEQARSEQLLLNVLPEAVVARLKRSSGVIANEFPEASVLFADIVNFTGIASRYAPGDLILLINEVFSHFDLLAERHGVEKIKTIGDCYMAAAGVPEPRLDHAEALAGLALDMLEYVNSETFGKGRKLSMRIGIHSGPLVAGIIGRKKFQYDLWGETVNMASRLESLGRAGAIQISRPTYERIQRSFDCLSGPPVRIGGVGEVEVWHILGKKSDAIPLPEEIRQAAG